MSSITATLVSGQTAVVGIASSREAYEVEVFSGVVGAQGVSVISANVVAGMLNLTLSNSAVINAGSVMAFANTGTITFTDNVIGQFSNGEIVFSTSGNRWTLNPSGEIVFPDNTVQTTAWDGYGDVPQNYTNTSFTIAMSDRGKHIYTDTNTVQTITIANNATVAFPVGTTIAIVTSGTGTVTVARDGGVSLYLAANNTNADRTLAPFGMATLLKVATDTWFIDGAGVN